jgi:hypothetical protein
VHLALVPSLDPRTWQPPAPDGPPAAGDRAEPVAVAIDILDEDHSLRLAMRRLARDADLRDRLGRAARRHWEAEHSFARTIRDYDRVMALAARMPARGEDRPPHLRPAALDRARALTAGFGAAIHSTLDGLEPGATAWHP